MNDKVRLKHPADSQRMTEYSPNSGDTQTSSLKHSSDSFNRSDIKSYHFLKPFSAVSNSYPDLW
uniref:Uncharacterized protein n=1 Tax=Helianthus annuus TaxID=4232 RepID=A0A251VEH4_HELAN